jgi:folate-dependent phosphoribosylglycinamide formyltransferase PurN
LQSTSAKFINTYTGITPLYRDVHGGYWALFQNDKENCDVTVLLVDEGIDTGNIIYQFLIQPTKHDNFSTYPLLQLSEGCNWILSRFLVRYICILNDVFYN